MAKKKKKKRDPFAELDENGKWVSERTRILGAIRRSFRLSPQMQIVMQEARVELPPKLKKDGTPGARNQVRFKCAMCKELFPSATKGKGNIAVDHIEPVVRLWEKLIDFSYDKMVDRIHCTVDNLQVLCSIPMKRNDGKPSCHHKKTQEENFIRKYLFKQKESYKGVSKKEINALIKEAKVLYKEKQKKKVKKKVKK